MSIFISAKDAYEMIKNSLDTVILDCRGDLNNQELGFREYQNSHLAKAQFFDGEKELSGTVSEHGGRHPLPDLKQFAEKLQNCGVNNNSLIIVYGLYAPRMFFMLNLIGLENVFIIDGGFIACQRAGLPVEKSQFRPKSTSLKIKLNSEILVSMAEVKSKLYNPKMKLIDSRAPERYRGEVEPFDKIAGHIPGAENYFWQSNFSPDNFLKSKTEILDQISHLNLKADQEKILYCGSGITAAYNYLVFKELGIKTKIYAGSYSDWLSYPENEIRTVG